MSTMMCPVETFRVDFFMVQEVIFKISAKLEHDNITKMKVKFWPILHCKTLSNGGKET